MINRRSFVVVLGIIVVAAGGAAWYAQTRPQADIVSYESSTTCPADWQAVVTTVSFNSTSGGKATLASYNQYGEELISGPVSVAWRRSYVSPVTHQRKLFGAEMGVNHDLYLGSYTAGTLHSSEGANPIFKKVDNRDVYYLELGGTSSMGAPVKGIGELSGSVSDRQSLSIGLTAFAEGASVTCNGLDGQDQVKEARSILHALKNMGGGGQIILTDGVVSGQLEPADGEAHQWRLSVPQFGESGETLDAGGELLPPHKGPLGASVTVEGADAKVYNFSNNPNGHYWWLLAEPRAKGKYKVTISGGGYATDWVNINAVRTPVNSKQPLPTLTTQRRVDPAAAEALARAGVPDARVTQGVGNAGASAGTHAPEPGSQYGASVDIQTGAGTNSITGESYPAWSEQEIQDTVSRMRMQGWAAFYRPTIGDFPHIHAVYAGACRLKDSTDSQVRSLLQGRNGLSGNPTETIMPPTPAERDAIAKVYASPTCSNDQSAQTNVALHGAGGVLVLAPESMDGMYSSYFGRLYPSGYPRPGGDLLVSKFDTVFDRGNYVSPDDILNGKSGSFTLTLKGSYGELLPDHLKDLVVKYDVVGLSTPWHDTTYLGYGPGGFADSPAASFEVPNQPAPKSVVVDYNFGGLSEAERYQAYKWGIGIVRRSSNHDDDPGLNEVIIVPHQAEHLLDLYNTIDRTALGLDFWGGDVSLGGDDPEQWWTQDEGEEGDSSRYRFSEGSLPADEEQSDSPEDDSDNVDDWSDRWWVCNTTVPGDCDEAEQRKEQLRQECKAKNPVASDADCEPVFIQDGPVVVTPPPVDPPISAVPEPVVPAPPLPPLERAREVVVAAPAALVSAVQSAAQTVVDWVGVVVQSPPPPAAPILTVEEQLEAALTARRAELGAAKGKLAEAKQLYLQSRREKQSLAVRREKQRAVTSANRAVLRARSVLRQQQTVVSQYRRAQAQLVKARTLLEQAEQNTATRTGRSRLALRRRQARLAELAYLRAEARAKKLLGVQGK